jgi:SAM-dependent methyltransferase
VENKNPIGEANTSQKGSIFVPRQWCYPLFIRNLILAELLKKYVKGVVLDYGCAGGKRFEELRSHNPAKLIAFDLVMDPEAVSRRDKVDALIQADGKNLPFDDGSFDFILANHVIEHIDDLNAVLREIHRVLAPGGTLLLGVPTLSTLTFYMYYPFSYILYQLMRFISMRSPQESNVIAHGKRMALVGDKGVMKIINLFEAILVHVPTGYLKTVVFSLGFTMWGAIFNHRDHVQKHSAWWWKKKFVSANLQLVEEVPVGYFPLFITNLFPRSTFPVFDKLEGTLRKNCFAKQLGNLCRDHFFVLKKT